VERQNDFLPSILDLIQNARHSVYIATFILGKDETGRAIHDRIGNNEIDDQAGNMDQVCHKSG
jgi:phosphatidylserine/phosphatidylglycerophosphate/cardiolipin synthase-like enzyme